VVVGNGADLAKEVGLWQQAAATPVREQLHPPLVARFQP
jgi:hypothetical protein